MSVRFLNAFRKVPWWTIIISILLIADLVWRYVDFRRYGSYLAVAQRFRFQETNQAGEEEGKCVAIFERNILMLTEFTSKKDGKVDWIELYWQGRPVCHLGSNDNSAKPSRVLEYYDQEGKHTVTLFDYEGEGDFHGRAIYVQGKPRFEVWLDGMWKASESRDQRRGIILNGQWFQLEYTNAAWRVVQRRVNGER